MLERLERWAPRSVKRDDLAIDYCLVAAYGTVHPTLVSAQQP